MWEFTDCYFCTWMLVCTILCTTVFEPVCPIVFTDRFRICDLPILCTTILHLPMWWTDCMIVCCMLFHTDVMQLLPRSKQISPLGDTINWLDLIFEHQTITILSWYYTLTTTCCDQHGQCCLVPPVCRFLPGPPDGAVNWTLLFGDIGLEWRAQLNLTTLSQPWIRGGPKVLEVIQHYSVG